MYRSVASDFTSGDLQSVLSIPRATCNWSLDAQRIVHKTGGYCLVPLSANCPSAFRLLSVSRIPGPARERMGSAGETGFSPKLRIQQAKAPKAWAIAELKIGAHLTSNPVSPT